MGIVRTGLEVRGRSRTQEAQGHCCAGEKTHILVVIRVEIRGLRGGCLSEARRVQTSKSAMNCRELSSRKDNRKN